jgi:S-adenosyl-L-methionine hydrolase (adenosine-forming)
MMIVLFTDFGSRDLYVGQVKAVLDREAPGMPVIDLLNDVPAFNIRAAAHVLASLVPEFPQGSVLLAVVDPGVGGPRAPVALRADGYRFVGPDNGLLSVFAARAAHVEAFRIVWAPERLTPSFQWRDLFAPVAARMAVDSLPRDCLRPLPGLAVEFGAGDLAEIVYVDHFGNAMTGIRAGGALGHARLVVNGHCLDCARAFSSVPQGEVFWYENSQSLVEIAVNQGSAAERLGLKIGDRIVWAT